MQVREKKNIVKKKSTTKTDPKILLEKVVDKELLSQRKNCVENTNVSPPNKGENIQKNDKKYRWWNNMDKSKFTTRILNNEYYAQYETWSSRVWIGPYATEQELNEVINSYITESKKEVMCRNIKNLHSAILPPIE